MSVYKIYKIQITESLPIYNYYNTLFWRCGTCFTAIFFLNSILEKTQNDRRTTKTEVRFYSSLRQAIKNLLSRKLDARKVAQSPLRRLLHLRVRKRRLVPLGSWKISLPVMRQVSGFLFLKIINWHSRETTFRLLYSCSSITKRYFD